MSQATKPSGYTVALLVLMVCLVFWDNSLEKIPYIYTPRSVWLRALVAFPAWLLIFLSLYKSSRKHGGNWLGKTYSVPQILLSIVAMSAALAWMSIDIPIGLAKAFSHAHINGEYMVVDKTCLRDMCQLKLRPGITGDHVTVPFSSSEIKALGVTIGSQVSTVERHSIFGGIVTLLNVKL